MTSDSTVSMPSLISRVAPEADTPERFARAGEVGFGGTFGVEPRAAHSLGGGPIGGWGRQQCEEREAPPP